ncbi:hypothetical protein ACHAW5_006841 [Stephanodiscus triporus]|uniref:HTH psq-type domain-containing protein n=1 Tax=Stephanodiscus triporus TaxID=2934178 RepID=A0ABD3PYW2_9STRA
MSSSRSIIKRPTPSLEDDDGDGELSRAPPADPIVAADHSQPAPPPAKVARLGGVDDGVDDDDAPGANDGEVAVEEEADAAAVAVPALPTPTVKTADEKGGGEEDARAPFSGEVPLKNEDDGGANEESTMAVVADAADVAEDMPTLPPYEGKFEEHIGVNSGADHCVVGGGKSSRKDRKEFTAEEKLQIISEISALPSVQSVLDKYGVSKSSLHRWRQPEKFGRLKEMVMGGAGSDVDDGDADGEGGRAKSNNPDGIIIENRDKFRKRDLHDKLRLIRLGLRFFCKENMNRDEDERLAITSSLIRLKAAEIKEDLLGRGEIRDEDELAAIMAFKGSKSWACLMGNKLGYLSSGGSIKWSEQQKANTAAYLEAHSRTPSRAKKNRTEFTTEEKLAILEELEATNARNKSESQPAVTVEQICQKYSTSKSSLHRWKQQYRSGQLQQLAAPSSGFSSAKRISTDRLHLIKHALNDFYIENENAPPDKRVTINCNLLQAKAIEVRNLLLERQQLHEHEQLARSTKEGESGGLGEGATREEAEEKGGDDKVSSSSSSSSGIISKEEVSALKSFKASSSWLRETARKFCWKLELDGKRDASADTVDDGAMISTTAATVSHQHYHYSDDAGMTEHVASEQHAAGAGQHVGMGGMENDDGLGVVQGGHQQHLSLAMPAYDAQGDAMDDVVDFNHEDSNTFDV